jgi:hypothetical protein
MKPHHILKDFNGSQTGHDIHEFVKGTVADLSRDLAAIVVKEGWAEPAVLPRALAEGEMLEAAELPEGSTATEVKAEEAAPENKMKKAAPENKKAKK